MQRRLSRLLFAVLLCSACGRTDIVIGLEELLGSDTDITDNDPGGDPGTQPHLLFVTDAATPRIQVFDRTTGVYLRSIGDASGGAGALVQPRGLIQDRSGNLWVADTYASSSFRQYSQDGTLLRQFAAPGGFGSGNGQFDNAWTMALDSAGNFWVADNGNNRLQKLDTNGNWLMTVGSAGSANGKFNFPNGGAVVVDSIDRVWVADDANNRVQVLDGSTGAFVGAIGAGYNGVTGGIGTAGTGDGQFTSPIAIAFDASGKPWVLDQAQLQKFDPTTFAWEQSLTLGTYGASNDGAFYSAPAFAFDTDGSFWVTDGGNGRVQKLAPDGTWRMTIGGGNGCAGSYTSSASCAPLPGLTSCCPPDAASCTCTLASSDGNFLWTAAWGVLVGP